MASFLEDISGFYGTGEVNQEGQDLNSFLKKYEPGEYERPSVTADILVFQEKPSCYEVERGYKLLMIQRKNHPSIGFWALPGGFVEMREDIIEAAKRELEEETHLVGVPMEQLYTWGEYQRDPRTRIITTSFLAFVKEKDAKVEAGDDAQDAAWMDVAFSSIGRSEVEGNTGKKIKNIYELVLSNKEKGVSLVAKIAVTENKDGILKERAFQVLDSKGIAFDHPRVIVQGLLYIKSLNVRK